MSITPTPSLEALSKTIPELSDLMSSAMLVDRPNDEIIVKVKRKTVDFLSSINSIFPEYITKKSSDLKLEFFSTPEFFETIVSEHDRAAIEMNSHFDPSSRKSAEDMLNLVASVYKVFDTLGMRIENNGEVKLAIHTTHFAPNEKPRQSTEEELFFTSAHEGIHDLVADRLEMRGDRIRTNRGLKVYDQPISAGEFKVEHRWADENAVDTLLTFVIFKEQISSWQDLLDKYKESNKSNKGQQRIDNFESFILFLQKVFPNSFVDGMDLLARTYFQSNTDGVDGFFHSLSKAGSEPDILSLISKVEEASSKGDDEELKKLMR